MDEHDSLFINDSSHIFNVCEVLNIFRESGELCDVVLYTDEGMKLPAHKVVLSACSPYFRAMFTTNFIEAREPVIYLKHTDGYALRDMIDYFYSGKLTVNCYNVEEIIKLANVLQLKDLIEKCEVYLRRNMSPKNSLGLQAFAHQYSLKKLKEHAKRYSCWNFNDVKNEEEFLLLPLSCLKELIADDSLRAPSEDYIFEAVMKWILYDFNNRKSNLQQLLPHVRFPLMSPNYIRKSNIVQTLLDNFTIGASYIEEALKYQYQELTIENAILPKRFTPRASSQDIYVIGGWSNGQKLSTVQCFSVDTLKWTTVSNMNVAHVSKEDYFRVIVSNEELYTICYDKVMKYDPVENLWQNFAAGPEIQCKWAGVCEFNGEFYVIGGNSLQTSKRFCTEAREWKFLPLMNTARYYPGVAVMNDKIYVIGGLDNRWYPVKLCECYNPLTNTWEDIARMRTPRWSLGVAVLNNKLYAIGGSHNVEQFANTVEVYDPVLDSWGRSTAPMNYGRRCLGVAVVNNLIYVVGGRVANTIECYNEEENEWKVIGSVQTCCNFGCVALRIL
ncbi:kelch-like protein 20 [Hydractinia symbiolongicarpus]|nr:kelch-like protein 20 [Hydractinia symbiolongicarpus]